LDIYRGIVVPVVVSAATRAVPFTLLQV